MTNSRKRLPFLLLLLPFSFSLLVLFIAYCSAKALTIYSPNDEFDIPTTINHIPVTFELDTGATYVTIPKTLAQKLNLKPNGEMQTYLANNSPVTVQTVTIPEIDVGNCKLFLVQAQETSDDFAPLFGFSGISRLDIHLHDNEADLSCPDYEQ